MAAGGNRGSDARVADPLVLSHVPALLSGSPEGPASLRGGAGRKP